MPPRDRQRMAVLHDLPKRMRMLRRVPTRGHGPKAGSNPGVWVWESVFEPGRRIPSLPATGQVLMRRCGWLSQGGVMAEAILPSGMA